jgi:hypothetical protein
MDHHQNNEKPTNVVQIDWYQNDGEEPAQDTESPAQDTVENLTKTPKTRAKPSARTKAISNKISC